MIELKPCPFCGAAASAWEWNGGARVDCSKWVADAYSVYPHYVGIGARTMEEAIELWNRRAEQPPKEIPKRVLWTGWKGYRYTRYKCPNCEMPVRNDDAYCHRCGQHLMFPHISFTPYIPGQKQDVIVRWDDEG